MLARWNHGIADFSTEVPNAWLQGGSIVPGNSAAPAGQRRAKAKGRGKAKATKEAARKQARTVRKRKGGSKSTGKAAKQRQQQTGQEESEEADEEEEEEESEEEEEHGEGGATEEAGAEKPGEAAGQEQKQPTRSGRGRARGRGRLGRGRGRSAGRAEGQGPTVPGESEGRPAVSEDPQSFTLPSPSPSASEQQQARHSSLASDRCKHARGSFVKGCDRGTGRGRQASHAAIAVAAQVRVTTQRRKAEKLSVLRAGKRQLLQVTDVRAGGPAAGMEIMAAVAVRLGRSGRDAMALLSSCTRAATFGSSLCEA